MQEPTITGFELSPVQERLYTTSKGAVAFPCQSVIIIEGRLDAARLQKAVADTIARYEILRTNFRLMTGRRRPVQIVQPEAKSGLEIIARNGDETPLDTIPAQLRETLLDLDNDNLARFHLLTGNDNYHLLISTFHSLVGDAQTLNLVNTEILARYNGAGEPDEEALQYADFAAWQRDSLQSDEPQAREGREFWRTQAASAQPTTGLPYEGRVTDAAFAPEFAPVFFPKSLFSQTAEFSQTADNAEDFLRACWLALFSRLTHQEQGTLGLVVDGRTFDELVTAPGPMAKTVPLAWAMTGDMIFAQVLTQTTEATAQVRRHQDYFAPDDAEGAAITSPLGFAWESRFPSGVTEEYEISLSSQRSVADAFGLALVAWSADGNIFAQIQYDSARFPREDVSRLAEQFALFAEGAAANPAAKISEIALLPAAEKERILVEWNQTDAEFPQDACIHHLFERQVERTPNAPALICGPERYTYAELNAKTNQIAHYLKAEGVGPNVPVALCAERSADMIVGLLAALKAGGFYVPLAADLPPARLQALLEQTGAKVVLSQKPLSEKFGDWNGLRLWLDAGAEEWNDLPTENPAHDNSPDDTAYVIFTSGSTGVPKGVLNRHRGLVNYAAFIAGRVGVTGDLPQCHFGTVSTLSADLGNTAVFPSLAFGGCLHVIGYETAMDGGRFASYVRENPLDLLKITPSHLRALLASSESDILPRKFLLLGGEAFAWDLLNEARRRGSCEIINHYGPTETTIGSLTYTTSTGTATPEDSATVPIGRPISNTKIYILDEAGNPVPVGVSGELCIGGAGLAAGYLNQPEQTAERFVVNPFVSTGVSDGMAKMYRTGDRARYLTDGSVEFLGRIDDQVKIRGLRVEPGEVESVLRRYPGVRAAAVLVTEDAQGAKRLSGYYVASSTNGLESLREHLCANLPDYMVPSVLISLTEIPLTPNGKIDRRALLTHEETAQSSVYEAGRTPTEIRLAEIWAQILERERVGIHEDFFGLGGHSLLMTQILARIRSVFQVQLALHTLFDNPTVAALSTIIDAEQTTDSEDEEMRRLLAELEGLSEDEVNQLLNAEATA